MQLTKEAIINAFKKQGMLYKTMKGDVRHVIHEHDFERAAEQILKELQSNAEPPATIAANPLLGGPKAEQGCTCPKPGLLTAVDGQVCCSNCGGIVQVQPCT